jgi:hypothetical protein
MSRTWIGLGALGATLLILYSGCKHDDKTLKPPKEDAVYRLPPDDSRYSGPPKYPDGTLNKFPKRDMPGADDPGARGPGSRFGMGGPQGGP